MKAVVLCAGLGTRLGHLTKDNPKPMLKVGDNPILVHILGLLKHYGFNQVALNLHYKADKIIEFFGNGSSFGISLNYSLEEKPLGTAGALRPLYSWLSGEENFLVFYGDIVTDQDLSLIVAKHRQNNAFATLLVHQRAVSNSAVGVDFQGRVNLFVERPDEHQQALLRLRNPRPQWVNSGIQILSIKALDAIIKSHATDLPKDIYMPLHCEMPIYTVPLTGRRYAVDSPQRLESADKAVKSGSVKTYKMIE